MSHARTIRFDGWVLRTDVGELIRDDRKIRLQDQPLLFLDELLAQPGELVTREQLIARLWPKGVVDFDNGLNSAVHKLRIALQDDADTPRYIETVPRRGYRFIGTIDAAETEPAPTHPDEAPSHEAPAPKPVQSPVDGGLAHTQAVGERRPRAYAYTAIGAGAAVLLIVMTAAFYVRHQAAPAIERYESQTLHEDLSAGTLAVLPLRTSASDEASILLAQSMTDLIRNRFAVLGDLTVVAGSSTSGLPDTGADIHSIGQKLNAGFLLKGGADRGGERLRVDIELVEAPSGRQLWSAAFDRPLTEAAAIREEIFQQVAALLDISDESVVSHAAASAEISIDAYQLYLRGQQLLANSTATDAERAIELFRRATILDPGFARAYLGLGQALLLESDLRKGLPWWVGTRGASSEVRARAAKAFDRALELSPALGEAWVERALLTRNPIEAEALYRKGLELAPNYGAGYLHYAKFLHRESRGGEAIEKTLHARRIDPLTPELHLHHAFLLMVTRSDVAGHDRLVREALEINPKLPRALGQLAYSRWEYSGEFADAAQLIERAIAVDPQSLRGRMLARSIYLDLRDPVAAAAVLGDSVPSAATMEIAQYDGDREGAAALLKDMGPESWQESGTQASMAEAIRDGAIATGDFEPAVRLLESVYAMREGWSPMWSRAISLVYAHTLVLAGESERGRRLAESTLALVDTHGVGRTEHWFSRERAAAFAVLGEDERVLEELAHSVRNKQLYRWWYLAERDPLYEHLRDDPRFQALNEQARQHLDRQRTLLDELRHNGKMPIRTASHRAIQ